jgi:hypothetical protein
MDVTVQTVQARTLAAVRRRVKPGEVGAAWRDALDQVWTFLRAHPELRRDGHNVFIYTMRGDHLECEFGVEVVRAFDPVGEVICTATPSGRAATAVHVGGYDQLHRAHDAIRAWRAREACTFTDTSWEIYGDWSDDPAKLETTVCYQLAP